ncbi:endoglucanase [Marchantia polymorpha subsp. ruderalis]|uniref:Endoglucanase n=2 Tax=Marchantia polymorpha TaxID=3197 RepID=A0AAF6ASB5_MARPO|nr:hypothetical protein MARPO_0001s0390 [Marchantia polymorpha]BBM99335.1 hypothetical protein Mp_1g20540 [Marchantia polymorpha subsp. ruderalis]|eukprot:PTQ50418.1 hypothetical protein MARPO_0001s0390 [Marchantia polymorpha]
MGFLRMEYGRDGMRLTWSVFPFAVMLALSSLVGPARASPDYTEALRLSLYFFEAQRSGYLPADQRVNWRSHSGLNDGKDQNIDLVGGYYDAGDNVKFQLPMAFTVTTLAWSVIEYRSQLQKQGQLDHALKSIKWGTDYFIKAHPEPNVLWAEVGDGTTDHECWMRPEDMTTSRQAYKVDANNPGTEVVAETAAAMAAASIVFKYSDPGYSNTLLTHAKQLFTFGDTHRGNYDRSIPIVKGYYPSVSGYGDELLWASFWLFEATGDENYLEYTSVKAQELGGTGWAMTQFGWDVKYSGLQVLASKILMQGRGGAHTSTLQSYQRQASYFLCAALSRNNGKNIQRSPGGLFWIQPWNNMQFVTSAAFLLTVYADYLKAANQELTCSGSPVQTSELSGTAQKQIDYILGHNPRGMSYMVGFSNNYPKEVHHRGSSIVSIKVDSAHVQCKDGYATWYKKPQANPNVLLGALVGGPDANDNFIDDRDNYQMTEACLYNNGPLVGVLARLSVGPTYQGETERPEFWTPVLPKAPDSPRSPPPPPSTYHNVPWKITEFVQEWQSRSTALVELKLLDLKWEGFWIQGLGCAWLLLYRCIYRLAMAWFMYGRLGVGAVLVFSRSLARRLTGLSVG